MGLSSDGMPDLAVTGTVLALPVRWPPQPRRRVPD